MQSDNYSNYIGAGIEIYGSREKIRSQIIDFAKDYLQLQTVDLYKTSLLSYIVDTLSILSANHYFYDSVIYREFFMVEAQMSESVYNLARWIGYAAPRAKPSTVDMLFTIPLSFESSSVVFNIPNTFKVNGDATTFLINSRISNIDSAAKIVFDKQKYIDEVKNNPGAHGTIINSTAITITDSNGYQRPIVISPDGTQASFLLPFTQHEKMVYQFLIPSEVQPYQFYSKIIDFSGGMISAIRVWVTEPGYNGKISLDSSKSSEFTVDSSGYSYPGNARLSNGQECVWTEWSESEHGVYTMSPNATEFVFSTGMEKGEIFFGNGILGKQPVANSAVTIELYITQGEDGSVIPHSITNGDTLYYTEEKIQPGSAVSTKTKTISYTVTNPGPSVGGINSPTLPEVKSNAIINLRSKERLVSDLDYDDINSIVGSNFPVSEGFPIMKRSDLKVNEMMLFTRLMYHDKLNQPQIVPTRNAKFDIYDPVFTDDKYTITRTTPITIDNEEYQTMFNMTITKSRMMAYYDYVLQNVIGTPANLYSDGQYSWYNSYIYMALNTVDFNIQLSNETTSSSSSTSQSGLIYALNIKTNVNHIPDVNAPTDYQFSEFRCKMITKWDNNQEYDYLYAPVDHSIDSAPYIYGKYSYFTFEIPNYLTVPDGVQRFEFNIDGYGFLRDADGKFIDENGTVLGTDPNSAVEGWIPYAKYYTDVMIRKDMSDVMYSTVTKTNTWDGQVHENSLKYQVHNVPTILSNYLNDGSNNGVIVEESSASIYPNFEIVVMQSFVNSLSLSNKRMLTDSINVKFPNTHGKMKNLKYNPVDYTVESRYKTPFGSDLPDGITFTDGLDPWTTLPATGTVRYIVNGPIALYSGVEFSSYINSIAELYRGVGEGGSDVWYLTKPTRGMYVQVKDELDDTDELKVLVYNGTMWIDVQSFNIPLSVKVKVEIDPNVTMSSARLQELIKSEIITKFSPYMGVQKKIDRSEIVTVVRSLPQVLFCELIEPAVDIRFNYEINKDLTQEQLIDYTPSWIGITYDSISVEIVT